MCVCVCGGVTTEQLRERGKSFQHSGKALPSLIKKSPSFFSTFSSRRLPLTPAALPQAFKLFLHLGILDLAFILAMSHVLLSFMPELCHLLTRLVPCSSFVPIVYRMLISACNPMACNPNFVPESRLQAPTSQSRGYGSLDIGLSTVLDHFHSFPPISHSFSSSTPPHTCRVIRVL